MVERTVNERLLARHLNCRVLYMYSLVCVRFISVNRGLGCILSIQ